MKSSPRPSCESDRAAARVVRAARREANLSQEALADLAGLHRTYISLLERSRRSPTLATLEAIARALGMTPAHFIGLISESSKVSDQDMTAARNQEASPTAPLHAK